MQHKRALLRVVFMIVPAALAGCTSRPVAVSQPPPSHLGANLTIACPDKKNRDLLETYSRNWASQQKAQVRTVLSETTDPPPEADLWVIPVADLPRLANAGLLRPLPEQYAGNRNAAWMDLLPLYRDQLLVWDQKPYGLPLVGEAPMCAYRNDRFGSANLAPPQSWEQFADAAEYFRTHGPDGQPAPSLPPLPADDDGLTCEFFTIAAGYAKWAVAEGAAGLEGKALEEAFSFHANVATGKPRIDAPAFLYALRLMRDRLQPCRPAGAATDPAAAFRAGTAVLCLTDVGQLVSFQAKKQSAVADRFGVCRTPGAGVRFDFTTGAEKPIAGQPNYMPYLGAKGYLAVVPQKAAAPDAAFALAAELYGRDTSRQIVIEPGRWDSGPIRLSQLDDTRLWDALDLDAARTAALRDSLRQTLLHPNVLNPALRLRTPDQAVFQQILAKALREVLEGKADPAAALQAVARRWTELDAKNPQHLAEYRMSVGLLPR